VGVTTIPPRRRPASSDDGPPVRLDPLTVDTADGHTWDGLALLPRGGDPARRRLAVIVVHGSVGNYVSGVPRRISQGIAAAGYTVVSVNTRMANYGVFFGTGLLHRTPWDLDAWVDLVRRMGHRRIVLLGYSLGATMVTHFQALRHRPEVVGVCTLAHPLSLPASLRRRWERFGARPDYATVADRALAMIGGSLDDDRGDDEIFIVERASGPTDAPHHAEIWTYRTWWFSRGPRAAHAVSAERIGALDVPVALIQAADDMIVPSSDGEELAGIARDAGVPARLEHVPHANHVFSGREDAAVARCLAWLGEVAMPAAVRG
jgi:dienelactone hydrolase